MTKLYRVSTLAKEYSGCKNVRLLSGGIAPPFAEPDTYERGSEDGCACPH
jgi:hypothetical protein